MNNEQTIRAALSRVLTNVANYPDGVSSRLLGMSLSKVIGEATEAVMKTGLIEQVDELYQRPLVDRVEVIDGTGRAYTNYDAAGVCTALQDGGKTLKVFITKGEE